MTAVAAWPGRGRAGALLVGVLAAILSAAGAGRPSLWIDEAATLSASTRSLSELWALWRNVDAVHGLYDLLLHVWFLLFPVTETWARLPSALAVGVAAAGVVVLGRQLCTPAVGVAAGVVFAVLPRTTLAGGDARSYALTIACAVWLTVLVVLAARRNRAVLWVGYAAALAVTIAVNVMVLLLVVVHAVLLLLVSAPSRRTLVAWVIATVAAVAAVSPLLLVIVAQQSQVGWIWPVSLVTLGQVFGEQYFPSVYSDAMRVVGPDQNQFTAGQLAVAMRAWARVAPLIVVIAAISAVAVWRRGRAGAVLGAGPRLLIWTAAVWIAAPTALLIGYSLVDQPLYQPHYLTFTTPGVALLVGLAVVVVGRDVRRIGALLVAIALAALPNYLAQRGLYAKYGSDYSQTADFLAAESRPGDCLTVDAAAPPTLADALEGARLHRDDRLSEVGRVRSALERDALFAQRWTPAADELRGCAVLWVVTDQDRGVPDGFRAVERRRFNQTEAIRAERDQLTAQ